MAWRLHEYVLRGEIDNRVRGRVTGRVWLTGVDEPLTLDLAGNAALDLAGRMLSFSNPQAVPMPTKPPASRQRGQVITMTAARKARVFDIPIVDAYMMLKRGEKPPEHLANCVRLEWVSDLSGCVVIESAGYELEVSEPAWHYSDAERDELKRLGAQAAERTAFVLELHNDDGSEPWDEFRCEQLLRESDLTGEKYRQLLEKYADHPDQERIIAREMGWEWLEEALDEAEVEFEMDDGADDELEEDAETEPDPAKEGIDWVRDDRHESEYIHPVAKIARDALSELMDECRGKMNEDEEAGEFLGQFMTLRVKLSAALDFIVRGERWMDRGLVIAWLKRALEIHNRTLLAADGMEGHPVFPPERLAYYRDTLFRIREGVLAVITRLRDPNS